ncbi:hypothetical protein JCM11491_002776 [Sporobolomyces phaffii]
MQRTLLCARLFALRPAAVPSCRTFSSTRSSLSSVPPPSSPPAATEQPPTPVASGSATVGAAEVESKYFVPRSQFGELPVYSDVRNGGTRVLTVIRKVHGDVSGLHKDLSHFLHPSTTSYTKPQTQQIVIKGDWVREVKEWLSTRGF